jgi:tRNA(Arg) A34 adenosine deaminase TadA
VRGAIVNARIDRVVFGARDAKMGSLGRVSTYPRSSITPPA